MEIKVKIHRLFNNDYSNVRAAASMTLDGVLAVHGVKVMTNSKGGTWVALPSAKGKKEYYDVVHPLTAELRKQINCAVLSEYKRVRDSGEDIGAVSDRTSTCETVFSLFDKEFSPPSGTE